MYADDLLAPWHEQVMSLLPPLTAFDAHTHIGVNDPDGFKCTPQELLAALEPTRSRAVVFPMHEPDGCPPANDEVLRVAGASGGRLVGFRSRVDLAARRRSPERSLRHGVVQRGRSARAVRARAPRAGALCDRCARTRCWTASTTTSWPRSGACWPVAARRSSPISLAWRAIVGERAPQAPICRSIVALLDLEAELPSAETLIERMPHIHLFVVAAMLAATPDVPVE